MARKIDYKRALSAPYIVAYFAMLSTAFYLAFANISGGNRGDLGKAADSFAYTLIWLFMYVVLFGFIASSLPKIPKGIGALFIIIAISVAAYAGSGFNSSSMLKLLTLLMTFVFASWSASALSTDRFFEIYFKVAVAIGFFYVAAYPFLHNMTDVYDPLRRTSLLGLPSYAGLFAHKNHAGTFFSLAIVCGVARILSRRGQLSVFRLLGIGFLLVCDLLTGAVGPLLATVCCVALMVLLLIFRFSIGLGLIIAAFAVAIMTMLYLNPDLWVGVVGRDATFTGRQYLYDSWFHYFSQHPWVGYGFGEAFKDSPDSIGALLNYGKAGAHYQNFESGILQCAIDFGVAGLLVYGFIFIRSFIYAFSNIESVYIRDRLLPVSVVFYLLISSANEVLIVVGNTIPAAFLYFFYCKSLYASESARNAPQASVRRAGLRNIARKGASGRQDEMPAG